LIQGGRVNYKTLLKECKVRTVLVELQVKIFPAVIV